MNPKVCKADQINLIMECRRSGLSDYQWCEKNGIHSGTFYNWVSKLKKSGYTFPDPIGKSHSAPAKQEVVKVDLVECNSEISSQNVEQNTTFLASQNSTSIAAELVVGNITLRLFNGADPQLIQNTLQCIGGINHAW